MRWPFFLCFLFIVLSCSQRDLALFKPGTYFPREIKGQSDQPLRNDSPENMLENLLLSYNYRNYDLYQGLFDTSYRFYMSPYYLGVFNDGVTPPPDPTYWTSELSTNADGTQSLIYYKTLAQDLSTMRKMFDPANTKELKLSYSASPAYALSPDTVVYNIRSIELSIILRNDPSTTLVVTDNFGFAITQVWLIRGADQLWRIWRWYDKTYGAGDAN